MLILLCVGTVGYRLLCGLSWLDSMYFTVITVGYREVGELNAAGKIFTMTFLFSGVGVLAYAVSAGLELLLDDQNRGYLINLFRRRRSQFMDNHYIICGMGRVGRAVCQELAESETPFVVIDCDPDRISNAHTRGWVGLVGDASDDNVLQQANIARARGLVCTVDTDAANLFLLVSAKAINPELQVSARVNDEANAKKFQRAGLQPFSSARAAHGPQHHSTAGFGTPRRCLRSQQRRCEHRGMHGFRSLAAGLAEPERLGNSSELRRSGHVRHPSQP